MKRGQQPFHPCSKDYFEIPYPRVRLPVDPSINAKIVIPLKVSLPGLNSNLSVVLHPPPSFPLSPIPPIPGTGNTIGNCNLKRSQPA